MAGVRIRLDHKGVAEILKSGPFAVAIAAKAAEVKAAASAHHSIVRNRMPVKGQAYETDRAAQDVTIAHPGGVPAHAKYGILTQAAHAAGLEVNAAPPTLATDTADE